MTADVLEASRTLQLGAGDAFELFTARFEDWWPREFSWSGEEHLQHMGIEARQGGALFEIGPHGLRWDWGRVLDWEPPVRLTFTWQIGPDRVPVPDPEAASEVRVTFSEDTGATTVRVVHGHWERHGTEGDAYRDAFGQAWSYALDRLAGLSA